jgi:hypothetical protein
MVDAVVVFVTVFSSVVFINIVSGCLQRSCNLCTVEGETAVRQSHF